MINTQHFAASAANYDNNHFHIDPHGHFHGQTEELEAALSTYRYHQHHHLDHQSQHRHQDQHQQHYQDEYNCHQTDLISSTVPDLVAVVKCEGQKENENQDKYQQDLNQNQIQDQGQGHDQIQVQDQVENDFRQKCSVPQKPSVRPTGRVVEKRLRRARANDRERNRMHNLNEALERLRKHLPGGKEDNKMTKIETLKSAQQYIQMLSRLLEETKHGDRNSLSPSSSFSSFSSYSSTSSSSASSTSSL